MTYWVHSQPDDITGDNQRPCARDRHCRERDHKNQPRLGPRAFCSTDQVLIGQALAWLPEAFVRLHQMHGDKGTGQGERVSSSREPSIPLNLPVDCLLTDLAGLLESWAERVREVARLHRLDTDVSRRQRDSVVVEAAVRTLSAHLDALLALPAEPMSRNPEHYDGDPLPELSGADAGLDILDLHSRARSMLGLTPKHQDLPVPCWSCDLQRVRRWDGTAGLADQAECMNCGETYTHERYQLLMGEVYQRQQNKNRKAAS